MPKIPKLTNAFFGLSLEKATQVIAVSFIVLFSLVFLAHLIQSFMPIKNEPPSMPSNETSKENFTSTTPPPPPLTRIADLRSTTFFLEVSVIVQIVFSVYLLIGVQKTIHDYLMAWILLQLGFFFHSQVLVIINAFYALYHYPKFIIYFITQEIIIIAIVTYCVLVVYSYYRDIEKTDEDEIPSLTPGNG